MLSTPEYIRLFIEYNQADYAINNAPETSINTTNIELAVDKGYIISNETPEFIRKNPEYINIFIKKGTLTQIELAIKNATETSINAANIKLAIEKGYKLYDFSPEIIRSTPEYIKLFIENGQIKAINEATASGLTVSNIELAIEKGYEISHYTSSEIIRSNPEYIKLFIEKGQIKAINEATASGLTVSNIELAIEKGSEISHYTSSEIIRSNPEYIKLFIEKGQIRAINEATASGLNKSNIELAIEKGYQISKWNSSEHITSNLEYIKIFINKGQTDVIELAKDGILTDEIIELAIEKGYKPSQRAPKIITTNPKYINMLMTGNQANQSDIIDYISEQFLNKKIIEQAIKTNYKISENSLKIIRNNPKYIKMFIKNGQVDAIDYATETGLTPYIIKLAIKKGYKLSSWGSSEIIRSNPKYIRVFIKRKELHAIDYATEAGLTTELIELAIKKGYKPSRDLPKTIINNKEYIKVFIRKKQNEIAKYLPKDILTNFINSEPQEVQTLGFLKEAFAAGYEISDNTPDFIKNSPEYIKIFIENSSSSIYIENAINNIKEQSINATIIKLAIEKNYTIFDETPEFIKNNPEYIRVFIENGKANAIDYATEKGLTAEIIKLAIEKGYKLLSWKSSEIITSNPEYIRVFIENGQVDAIDIAKKGILTDELIELAINNNYTINASTPKIIKTNPKYIRMLIERKQPDALKYAKEEGLTDENINLAIENGVSIENLSINYLIYFLDKQPPEYIATLSEEIIKVYKDTKEIIKQSGKINTLDNNPVLSYNVIKYIYPNFGMDFTLNIIKYNTKAAENIVEEIKQGNIDILSQYLNLIQKYNIFADNAEDLHMAFKSYDKFKDLVKNILENQNLVSIPLMNNLKKVILNNNIFKITKIEELLNYEQVIKQQYDDIYNNCTYIYAIKTHLGHLFGYAYYDSTSMEQEFTDFQLDNFKNLKFVIDEILKNINDENERQIIKEKLTLTKEEILLIMTMKKIVKSDNIDELKEIFKKMTTEEVDFCDKVSELKRKIRIIHTYELITKLTNVETLKQNAKTYELDGVLVIEPAIEDKFNFLAHRIYNYDEKFDAYCKMIRKDPSLWTQLEGASTLSTSSISEKGLHMLHAEDTSGVIYLFNNPPEDFLLFMYEHDLYVSHGGHKIQPTANWNLMTDIDTLNQRSAYSHKRYNEIAGWRKGMMPCAMAYTGDTPNEDTIRAAKYFNVPIIKFNIQAYEEQKQKNQKQAMENFEKTLSYQDMYNIFYDGLNNIKIEEKINFCMNILINKQKNNELNTSELLKKIEELEGIVSRICCKEKEQKNIRKLELFKISLCTFLKLSPDEVIELETAQLGESGIMYKLKENGEQYLVKPAVDKEKYETQSFRAEIQKAASQLQSILSSSTAVNVESIGIGNLQFSKQPLIEVDKQETRKLIEWSISGGELDTKYKDALLREYVVDFLLCNFDSFSGNFIIDKDGNLRGIDKEQSFRFINNQETFDPSFSYVPNGVKRIPIYKILLERYNNGEIDLNLDIIEETIKKASAIPDKEYRKIFRKYAEALYKSNSEIMLNEIVERKQKAINILKDYINKLKQNKKSGDNNEQRRK